MKTFFRAALCVLLALVILSTIAGCKDEKNTIVLDGSNPGEGKTFNWNMLRGVNINKRIALAGGINESNVEEGIKSINPTIIDVSSGVEEMDEKGLYKCKDKMEILIKKVRMFY